MKKFFKNYKSCLVTAVLLLILSTNAVAQSPLKKTVSVQVNNQRLDNVLEILSNTGNFYFSYNSNIIQRDSLVSINITNKPVKEILDYLFNGRFEYVESGNYIIIRRKPITAAAVVKQTTTEDNNYFISGFVVDETTGEKINNVSVYEPLQLSSDLSDEKGYFKLKLKSRYKTAAITVSKENYKDTTITIQPKLNQQLIISIRPESDFTTLVTISPEDYFLPDSIELRLPGGQTYVYTKSDSVKVEKSWVGKFLLSSRQTIQSINLKNFFTTRNFQLSLTPLIGTQGKLSPQITNNYSVNIIGGYTGGVNVIEVGGVFNINKKNVQYVQLAGVVNLVGGSVKGIQAAGVHNLVLADVNGLQSAGVSNVVKGKFTGIQSAGVYNHVNDSVNGLQIAGVGNFAKKKVNGWQIAGVVNYSNQEIKGAQVSGVINYAKKLKGMQIGLINIADTSDGYSIGLLAFVKKGYRKLSISTDEMNSVSIAFKSGNHKLYSFLQGGINLTANQRLYSYGYGVGRNNRIGKHFSIATELSSQYFYAGSWQYQNLQNKFALNFQWDPSNKFSIYAGPSFSVFTTDQSVAVQGYRFPLPANGIKQFDFGKTTKGWIGFTAGIHLF